jgi:AmiR/NasT family two-component response regulator
VARAAERGISAWIASASPDVVQGAIEVALRRHEEAQRLQLKVDQLESALDRRSAIERAKGILMKREGLSESEAFERLRKASQISGRPLKVVADALIATLGEGSGRS